MMILDHGKPGAYPIWSRVLLTDFQAHGTVRAWQQYDGLLWYVVRTDAGVVVVANAEELQPAMPRPGWRPVVVRS